MTGRKLCSCCATKPSHARAKEGPRRGVAEDGAPDSACPAPVWQRGPVRVSFQASGAKETFAIRGHIVDAVNDTEEEDE